ncbi:MAG: hypothetical protein GX207_04640 [Peptococcaceae bacterium]|nr:hypothetical protein [Peptococcaceae bacterium]
MKAAIATLLWLFGMATILLYSTVSLIKLCRKLIGAVQGKQWGMENICKSNYLKKMLKKEVPMRMLRRKDYEPDLQNSDRRFSIDEFA